jgi:Putative Zn-dependent protease, contains TPR repeats
MNRSAQVSNDLLGGESTGMRNHRLLAALLALWLSISQLSCGVGRRSASDNREVPHFKPGFNLFSPQQDIELGRRSADEIKRQMPTLNDAEISDYVSHLGKALAAKAGGYEFPYEFKVIANKEINAFALPGGFVFVNAGAIVAAKNEGELAGVMAHEISHVALRHGTNQATKAYIARAGLGVLSRIAGGQETDLGQVINTIGGAGANALFLKFGRTAETQADLNGARIMAETNYDPRDMANFFKTLAGQGGQHVPELLSDHPDPGNRYEAVTALVPALPVSSNPVHDTQQFEQVKARLTGNRAAFSSSAEPERRGPSDPTTSTPATRPEPPSTSTKPYQSSDGTYALEYPANWDELGGEDANVIFAPKGGYGKLNDALVVTHGFFVGAVAVEGGDLQSASQAFIEAQLKANPDFRLQQPLQRNDFGNREGYAALIAGPSSVTGVLELDVVYTTTTSDGRLFYFITVAPKDEFQAYKPAFEQLINSIKLRE